MVLLVPNNSSYQPPPESLESILSLELIPRFTGRSPPCEDKRVLFAIPARLGGLGLRNPAESADNEFQSSRMVTDPLKKLILTRNSDYSFECLSGQLEAKQKIKEQREQKATNVAKELKVAENPVTFKVDKPGIQADRLLCLVKILAHGQFWESSTVHCP